MFKTYVKAAWRNLVNKKWHSLLNIGGLAIGMAATLLIGMWVYDELSYNTQFKNHSTVAQVMQSQTLSDEISTSSNVSWLLAPELRNTYGDHFKHVVTATFNQNILFTVGETQVRRRGNFMEAGITDMLSLNMLLGDKDALQDPNSILISKSTAEILFGDENPLEKDIQLGSRTFLKVAGVYEDLPENSNFSNLTYIGSWKFLFEAQGYEERLGWGNNWFQTFAQVQENVKLDQTRIESNQHILNNKPVIHLHPMKKWRLYSKFENGIAVGGRIDRVWLLGIIGFFILLLACINFMNLSTARSLKRAKEVGIRKTIGSIKRQLILQFLSESFLIVIVAFTISMILALAGLSVFNELTNKSIQIPWADPLFWLAIVIFIALTGFIAGSYPAFYLSSFNPASVLKGTITSKQGASRLRKALVVVQFTISIMLIIGTISVFKQVQHAKNRPLGYNKEGMLYVSMNNSDLISKFEAIREELLTSPSIKDVAASDVLATGTFTTNSGFTWKGKDPNFSDEFNTLRATHGYGDMIDWEIKEGRDFSREFKSDSLAFILNETAVSYMSLEEPVGEYIQWGTNGKYKVIGVAKDMVTRSPYGSVAPMIFVLHYGNFLNFINIKIKANSNTQNAIAHIQGVFEKYNPQTPFTYSFLDEDFAEYFEEEVRTGKLVSFFAILAILISCLGIFGLSAFVVEQRTKEIGVRKILGASVFSLWKMLSKDFLILVGISSGIAVPLGYHYMNQWIQDYTYSATLSWWIFAAAICMALTITILTISFQTIKASIVNPVKSLRTE